MSIYRQGDVLLVTASLPKDAIERPQNGDWILAYGEVTGHAHRIKECGKVRMWDAGAERFLQVLEATMVTHEEHAPIALKPGVYRLPQQVEYAPAELRRIGD